MQTHVENSEDTSIIFIDENQLLGNENKISKPLSKIQLNKAVKTFRLIYLM